MRLTTKGRFAVTAMLDLTMHAASGAVKLNAISERQQISLSYLEQLFARLRRRGLVKSLRGPGGGYRLAREAEHTNIADIVMAVDEPLRATRCGKSKGCMLKGERCMTHDLWEEMGRQLETYLASVSLEDLVSGRLSDRESRAA